MHIKDSNLTELLRDLNKSIFQINCAMAHLDTENLEREDFIQVNKRLALAKNLTQMVVEYFYPDDDFDCPEEPEEEVEDDMCEDRHIINDSDVDFDSDGQDKMDALKCALLHNLDEDAMLEEYAGTEASV
mgnify:CR=1 FL=1